MTSPVPWPATAVQTWKIADIRRNPRNSRTHTKAQARAMANALLKFGWTTAILVDEDGLMWAGHGRLDGAELLVSEGHTRFAEAPVMVAAGWSEAQKRAYMIADNQIAAMSGWDSALLASELQDISAAGLDMTSLGFGKSALNKAMGGPGTGGADPDHQPLTRAAVVSKVGDVWRLGPHRIMCGDSSVPAHVSQLMAGAAPVATITDPPYCSGGFREADRGSGSIGTRQAKAGRVFADGIANDKLSTRGYLALMKGVLAAQPTAILYAFTDWRMWLNLYEVAESTGYAARNMIVWDKGHPGMGRGWRTQHELIFFGARAPVDFAPADSMGNVVSAARTRNVLHPTQKPVDLLAKLMAVTRSALTVYDPFNGSGSTLIAAESEGRQYFGMELAPAYIDVTVRRWQELTGGRAVHDATGEPFPQDEGITDDAAWA